jgi:hypothetical protein
MVSAGPNVLDQGVHLAGQQVDAGHYTKSASHIRAT